MSTYYTNKKKRNLPQDFFFVRYRFGKIHVKVVHDWPLIVILFFSLKINL